ncbi:PAS domain S-box protein [Chloroflexota bacterium]
MVVNPDDTIQFMNRTISGRSPEDAFGTSIYDYIHPKHREIIRETIKKVYDTGASSICRIRAVGPDKSISSWLEAQVGPLKMDGQVIATLHVITDITERQRAEEALQETAQKLQLMFECAPYGITVRDSNGIITQVNDQILKIYGAKSKDELIGKSGLEFIAPQQRKGVVQRLHKCVDSDSTEDVEFAIVRADGSEISTETSVGTVRDASGNPVNFITITRDITEQKRLMENEKVYITETIKADENGRRRLARALHDDTIQELLLAMHRLQDAIEGTHGRLPKRAQKHLEEIRLLIGRIVGGVRRFTTDLRPDVLDDMGLAPALRWLTDRLRDEDGIEARLSVVGEEKRLSSDSELTLFRIAQEALSNVRRHSGATAATVTLEFQKKMVTLSIIDNGRGFEVPRMLSFFARKQKLGLTGIAERVRLLGGEYTVESSPGKGTVVKVEISV